MRRHRWRLTRAATPRLRTRGSPARSGHRHELVTYTTVSLVFVIIVLAIVFGLDNLFSWLTLKLFG
jgi:hypothetical protein